MDNQDPDGEAGSDTSSSTSANSRPSFPDYVVNFVNLVMETFEDQPDTFREYQQLMRDFKNNRISLDRLFFGLHLLFKEQKELLKEFNDKFVPEEYKGSPYSRGFRREDALALGSKIQRRLSQGPNVWSNWSSFLQILYRCYMGTYDRVDAFVKMSKLLEDHRDLLFEYWTHLPPII